MFHVHESTPGTHGPISAQNTVRMGTNTATDITDRPARHQHCSSQLLGFCDVSRYHCTVLQQNTVPSWTIGDTERLKSCQVGGR